MLNLFVSTNLSARLTMVCLLALSVFTTSLFPQFAFAQEGGKIYISVGEATVKKSLLALTPFKSLDATANPIAQRLGVELHKIISDNLDVSGYFMMVDPKAYLEDPLKVGIKPGPGTPGGFSFENWATIETDFLIRGAVGIVGTEMTFEVYVYHVPRAETIMGKSYRVPTTGVRKLAHTFSNDLIKALTGRPGMFLSSVVTSSNRNMGKFKEIFLMDWDGQNIKQLTREKSISISPAVSPDGKQVAFTSFAYESALKSRNANLYLLDLASSKRTVLSNAKGINSGATFFPDGRDLLLTISQGGNPDIYRMSARGTEKIPLTRGPFGAMNVEPSISPDAKKIAFSSDRSGSPMIYTMDIDGGNVARKTFAGKYNASPAWSPDGKRLAFAGFDKTHFDIFIMDESGHNMARLTSAKKVNGKNSNNEDPSFSPDGRYIMFASDRSGSYQLYIVSIDGTNERRITNDSFDYQKPRWFQRVD